ncbi:MAG: phosphodiester glycosidase family protein [Steroidobacteraceae bacterium]
MTSSAGLKPRSICSAVAATLVAFATVPAAQAATINLGEYTSLFRGVSQTNANIDGRAASIVRVDLSDPGIEFVTTAPCTGCTPNTGTGVEVAAQTTSSFLINSGVQVAINANRDAVSGGNASDLGLAVSNGVLVSPDQAGNDALLILAGNDASIVTGGTANLNGVVTAVAGTVGAILKDGVYTGVTDNQSANRSGLGLSFDGLYLYLLKGQTISFAQEAALFLALGADDAINLNGGQAASLYYATASGASELLDTGADRAVGTNLGIKARPLGEPLPPVPLPAAVWLLGSGLTGLMASFRRRRNGERGSKNVNVNVEHSK